MVKLFKTPYFFRWIYHRRVWGFSSSDTVYLTFDDGPTTELTEWILALLEEKNVKATFFCVGANILKHPELGKLIQEKGHAIGNHTMRHENGNKVDREEYFRSINETEQLVTSNLFRPPYGRMPLKYDKHLADQKIIMWSWLSYDFDESVELEKILKSADKNIKPGAIIVMHDNAKVEERVKTLLPQLIDLLEKKGYKFATISA
ncbi:MAG: polysaccharide deacetylase family protein [Crocinitomicaceae bacterium]|nr:polysaccharide deacetylase family protein [Crocinitomicaceae bacterium]